MFKELERIGKNWKGIDDGIYNKRTVPLLSRRTDIRRLYKIKN